MTSESSNSNSAPQFKFDFFDKKETPQPHLNTITEKQDENEEDLNR